MRIPGAAFDELLKGYRVLPRVDCNDTCRGQQEQFCRYASVGPDLDDGPWLGVQNKLGESRQKIMHVGSVARVDTSFRREKLIDALFLKFAKSLRVLFSTIRALGTQASRVIRLLRGTQARDNNWPPATIEFGDLVGDSGIGPHEPPTFCQTLPFKRVWEVEAVMEHEVPRVIRRPRAFKRKLRSERLRCPLEATLLERRPVDSTNKMIFLAYRQWKTLFVHLQETHQRSRA